MERELILDGEKLKFKMTNRTVINIDDKYDNFGVVINGVGFAEKPISNAIKVISESCVTRELSPDELIEKLTADEMISKIVRFAWDIYLDYKGIKILDKTETTEKEEKPKKKEKQK